MKRDYAKGRIPNIIIKRVSEIGCLGTGLISPGGCMRGGRIGHK